jgi:ADP-heptose:LPS heptosyltransferase
VHSVEQQLALLSWAGVPFPASPKLSLHASDSARSAIAERLEAAGLEGRGFAIVAPAAGRESKRWPASCFADVIDHLWEYWRLRAVLIAGVGEEHIADEVAANSRTAPCVLTKLTLRELIALISSSCLFLGNDGGPMHIAAALDRPVVAVFCDSNADVWHPWTTSPYRVIRSEGESGKTMLRDTLAAVDQVVESAVSASNS